MENLKKLLFYSKFEKKHNKKIFAPIQTFTPKLQLLFWAEFSKKKVIFSTNTPPKSLIILKWNKKIIYFLTSELTPHLAIHSRKKILLRKFTKSIFAPN